MDRVRPSEGCDAGSTPAKGTKIMLIKKLLDCEEFIAGDKTTLREILHPGKADLVITYSLAQAVLKPGDTSQKHKLKTSEVYYILEGSGEMHIGKETSLVKSSDTIYIPPHSLQYIKNVGQTDLKFLCIVDPAWKIEDEEVIN
jgi:mannose-6-phosphate isomerase-like protein (cupin superfamily)